MKKIVPYGDLTRSTGGKGWISFGQIYLGFGKIYVNACSGGETSGDNGYGLQPEKTSISIYKVNSDGSTVRVYNNPESPFDSCKDGFSEVEFGKAEGIEAGSHTYRIEMSGIDSHDGSHSATIEGIPAPPPIPGPIVTVRNKTGHFHSTGPIQLEMAAYTNGGLELEPKEIKLNINGTEKTIEKFKFPYTESVFGTGPQKAIVTAIDVEGNESKPIEYNFNIGTNDWSSEHLTPIKTINHTGNINGIVNLYTMNADANTELQFTDIFSPENICYANANTAEIESYGFDFSVYRNFEQTTDTINQHAELLILGIATPAAIPFSLVVDQPTADDFDYLTENRTVDHELGVFMCSYDGIVVRDECTIPSVVKEYCLIASIPNANSEYEFGMSGLIGRVQAKQITTHSITRQYYHLHYQPSDRHDYGRLVDNTLVNVNIKPEQTDTKLTIELFNSCGSVYSEDFDLKYVSSSGATGSIGGGGSSSGSQVTIIPNVQIAAAPNYHSLIVKR